MNKESHVEIMDIHFINTTKKDLLTNKLYPRLHNQEKSFIVTANPEIVMRAKEDYEYKVAIQSADYIIPDGTGIVIASRWKKQPLPERIPGYELMIDLLKYANEKGLSCYFLGAKDLVNQKVVDFVKINYPNLKIAGHHHGFFELKDENIVKDIKLSEADFVFVALGLPRQEMWIERHISQFNKGLFMGVGGSFDTLVGEVPRAPQGWIKLNLEWLYRLLKQPTRFKRILKVFEFMLIMAVKRK